MSTVGNTTFTGLEDSLYKAFESCDVGTGYFLHQNGVQPPSPYCTIFIVSDTPIGSANESATLDGNTQTTITSQAWEALIRFVFVGKDKQSSGSDTTAENNSKLFSMRLRSSKYRMLFADNGISIFSVSETRRNRVARENDIYSSYSIDLRIGYETQTTTTFDYIEHGSIVGTITQTSIQILNGWGSGWGDSYGNAIETVRDEGMEITF